MSLMRRPAHFLTPARITALAVLSWLALFAVPHLPGAEDPSARFTEANRLYDQGRFRDAATAYEDLLNAGYGAHTIYFNLGNAWFKSGQIGRALAAYIEAERSAPRDPDVRANLRFARQQVQGPSLTRTRSEQLLTRLTLNEWTVLAVTGLWVWLLLGTTFQWRPDLKGSLRGPFLILGLGVMALAICVALAFGQARSEHLAIVVVPQTAVKQGPLEEQQTAFLAHDGAELRVLDEKEDWLQVTTDPRRLGWVRRSDVLQLK